MHSHYQDAYLCKKCSTRIVSYGFPHIKLLSDICQCRLAGELCIYDDTRSDSLKPAIRFLERKGFVLTTEIDERHVAIYVNKCRKATIQENCFCWCPGNSDL